MLITCWSVKGGSGATVVAVALAVLASESSPTWIVDLGGDVPAALGMAEPAGPGIGHWLEAPAAVGPEALSRLSVEAVGGLSVLPAGTRVQGPTPRWSSLVETLCEREGTVVVDAGCGPPPAPLRERSTHDVLVLRPCYLALRRAAALPRPPTAVVLVTEPGRALRRVDVEHVIGVPVVAEVEWDPAVARAVDAGLLAGRLPRSLRGALGALPWAS